MNLKKNSIPKVSNGFKMAVTPSAMSYKYLDEIVDSVDQLCSVDQCFVPLEYPVDITLHVRSHLKKKDRLLF